MANDDLAGAALAHQHSGRPVAILRTGQVPSPNPDIDVGRVASLAKLHAVRHEHLAFVRRRPLLVEGGPVSRQRVGADAIKRADRI